MKSRHGRHNATASTWLLRYGLVKDRGTAVKMIKRRKVIIDGKTAQTRVGYDKPKSLLIKKS